MFNQTVRPMLCRSTLARAHRGRRHRCEAFGDDA
jgi:hypothetical protein